MSDHDRRCGYTVTDAEGIEEPCDRPATGWRWYQDVGEHEDMLDVACDWHANEGGRRIHDAEERVRHLIENRNDLEESAIRYLEQLSDIEAALSRVLADMEATADEWAGWPNDYDANGPQDYANALRARIAKHRR